MLSWSEFAAVAPRVAEVFTRRHAATGNLCMLGTLRTDGFPRISPVEPRLFADRLWVVGMPGTTKFRDLARDPRFCLHTATVDTNVGDGDAKLWGRVVDVQDEGLQAGFAADLFERTGFDLRGRRFTPFYAADLVGGSSLELRDEALEITVWRPGEAERVVRKT